MDRAYARDTLKGCEFRDALDDQISRLFNIILPRVPLLQELLVFVWRVAPHDIYLDFLISSISRPCSRGIHEGMPDTFANAIGVSGQPTEAVDDRSDFLDLSRTRNVIIILGQNYNSGIDKIVDFQVFLLSLRSIHNSATDQRWASLIR